jgi:hypothetical protein
MLLGILVLAALRMGRGQACTPASRTQCANTRWKMPTVARSSCLMFSMNALVGSRLYAEIVRVAKTKNGFSPKLCKTCGLQFEWRKKWAKNWEEVKFCSTRCRDKK